MVKAFILLAAISPLQSGAFDPRNTDRKIDDLNQAISTIKWERVSWEKATDARLEKLESAVFGASQKQAQVVSSATGPFTLEANKPLTINLPLQNTGSVSETMVCGPGGCSIAYPPTYNVQYGTPVNYSNTPMMYGSWSGSGDCASGSCGSPSSGGGGGFFRGVGRAMFGKRNR